MEDKVWIKINGNIRSFISDDIIIHIIPTTNPHGGSEEYYIIVHDDPYFNSTGKTEILSEKDLFNKYNIK